MRTLVLFLACVALVAARTAQEWKTRVIYQVWSGRGRAILNPVREQIRKCIESQKNRRCSQTAWPKTARPHRADHSATTVGARSARSCRSWTTSRGWGSTRSGRSGRCCFLVACSLPLSHHHFSLTDMKDLAGGGEHGWGLSRLLGKEYQQCAGFESCVFASHTTCSLSLLSIAGSQSADQQPLWEQQRFEGPGRRMPRARHLGAWGWGHGSLPLQSHVVGKGYHITGLIVTHIEASLPHSHWTLMID